MTYIKALTFCRGFFISLKMNNHTFLKAKHWQLFLLFFGVPFVAGISFLIVEVSIIGTAIRHHREPDLSQLFGISLFLAPLFLVGFFVNLRWQWAVATGLQSYMHPEMRPLLVKRFKFFFFFPWIYMLIFGTFFPIILLSSVNGHPNLGLLIPFILIMIICHFFALFCFIYTLYFIAKTLVSAELQREAHFSDYIGEFFLTWILPVGIWFLQPRINAIVNRENTLFEPKPANQPTSENDPLDF